MAKEILHGFTYGFKLNYTGPRIFTFSDNLRSASQFKNQLQEKILKEVKERRIMGPFLQSPMPNMHISPIGLVPKSSGGWRMITHLSYPPSLGINSFIDPELCTVRYTAFDTVVDMITRIGPGAELGKVDIKSAFRLLPVYPGDFELLGFRFRDHYYIDKCLPMGCSISCAIFEKFSTFLQWAVINKSGLRTVEHYLDDFIFVGRSGSGDCLQLMTIFQQLCSELGVPLAGEKTQGPVTCLVFLGLEIDTVLRNVKIPREKIQELKGLLSILINKTKVKLKELESLVGKLNFFSKAIRGSRAFNRRFYDSMMGLSRPNSHIRLTRALKEDMLLWLHFLDNFNGVAYFPHSEWVNSRAIQLYTDSAGTVGFGCGCYFKGNWTYYEWPLEWKNLDVLRDITFLELAPILLAVMIWGEDLSCHKVQFHTDNSALVSILNTQSSRSPRIMYVIRKLVLLFMQFNITFKAKHIAGIDNGIADAISRKQWGRLRQLAPTANQIPDPIPAAFHDLLSSVKFLDY